MITYMTSLYGSAYVTPSMAYSGYLQVISGLFLHLHRFLYVVIRTFLYDNNSNSFATILCVDTQVLTFVTICVRRYSNLPENHQPSNNYAPPHVKLRKVCITSWLGFKDSSIDKSERHIHFQRLQGAEEDPEEDTKRTPKKKEKKEDDK